MAVLFLSLTAFPIIEERPMTEQQQKKQIPVSTVLIALAIVFVPIILWLRSSASSAPPTSTYEAHITDFSAIDPATAQALVTVKNTGSVEAAPTCQISVYNTSRTYQGYDTFDQLKKLKPGEQWSFNATVTVTDQGAAYVTEGAAGCS